MASELNYKYSFSQPRAHQQLLAPLEGPVSCSCFLRIQILPTLPWPFHLARAWPTLLLALVDLFTILIQPACGLFSNLAFRAAGWKVFWMGNNNQLSSKLTTGSVKGLNISLRFWLATVCARARAKVALIRMAGVRWLDMPQRLTGWKSDFRSM